MRSKYQQVIIDAVRERWCLTRAEIISILMSKFELTYRKADNAAKYTLKALVRRGVLVRKGRGIYCRP